jgi:hypothetical protein
MAATAVTDRARAPSPRTRGAEVRPQQHRTAQKWLELLSTMPGYLHRLGFALVTALWGTLPDTLLLGRFIGHRRC